MVLLINLDEAVEVMEDTEMKTLMGDMMTITMLIDIETHMVADMMIITMILITINIFLIALK
jgi:hypothetical protein